MKTATQQRPVTHEGWSRRAAIGGCARMAVLAHFAPQRARGGPECAGQAELFAFSAPNLADLVFAVALPFDPQEPGAGPPLGVQLHAGETCWTIRPPSHDGAILSQPDGMRVFSGRVWRATRYGAGVANLIAIATPRFAAQQGFAVWAELVSRDGARIRVGHPAVACLLAGDARLMRLHAASDPTTDRDLLFGPLAERVAACGAAGEVSPAARAQRLVDALLPDILPFDPGRPGGFTFASINGRRPGDLIDQVIGTLVAGAAQHATAPASYRGSDRFPYFTPATAA